jgi:diamine N-acetyltransferase
MIHIFLFFIIVLIIIIAVVSSQTVTQETYNVVKINADCEDVEKLQILSVKTFAQAFSEKNNVENLNQYIEQNFSLSKLSSEIDSENSQFYFVEHDEQAIGYLKLNFNELQTESHDFEAIEIERIYVLASYYGKGVAKVLYNKALEIARSKSVDYIWLGVWEKNFRAISFYKNLDFEFFGLHEFKFGNEVQTDKLMRVKVA